MCWQLVGASIASVSSGRHIPISPDMPMSVIPNSCIPGADILSVGSKSLIIGADISSVATNNSSSTFNPHLTANQYLQHTPKVDVLNNAYVQIVHTNGINYLAMVSCLCHGPQFLPMDLITFQLLPASFVNIQMLFSAQLLDFFHLSNLELKASAYQFYQLLHWLTLPMDPSRVVDLYNKSQRMSRLWRWMKKLKWAGVGCHGKTALDIKNGELANYCPACPQPHINLPDNWKDNLNRLEWNWLWMWSHGLHFC